MSNKLNDYNGAVTSKVARLSQSGKVPFTIKNQQSFSGPSEASKYGRNAVKMQAIKKYNPEEDLEIKEFNIEILSSKKDVNTIIFLLEYTKAQINDNMLQNMLDPSQVSLDEINNIVLKVKEIRESLENGLFTKESSDRIHEALKNLDDSMGSCLPQDIFIDDRSLRFSLLRSKLQIQDKNVDKAIDTIIDNEKMTRNDLHSVQYLVHKIKKYTNEGPTLEDNKNYFDYLMNSDSVQYNEVASSDEDTADAFDEEPVQEGNEDLLEDQSLDEKNKGEGQEPLVIANDQQTQNKNKQIWGNLGGTIII